MKNENKICVSCGGDIPAARVKILPNVQCCVKCSDTPKKGGVFYSASKTEYGYHVLDGEQAINAQMHVRKRFSAKVHLSTPQFENFKDLKKSGELDD